MVSAQLNGLGWYRRANQSVHTIPHLDRRNLFHESESILPAFFNGVCLTLGAAFEEKAIGSGCSISFACIISFHNMFGFRASFGLWSVLKGLD